MKTFKLLTAFLIATLLSAHVHAGLDLGFAKKDGGQAGSFLDFAASARSLGMGGAHTAVTNDAGATYWNPAGLGQIDRKDVVTMYSALYENTGYGFFGYAQPTVDMGTFGLGIVSLRASDYDKRDGVGQQKGTFSQADTALLLSYGFKPGDRLALGLTGKVIREEIDIYSATSYGADLGMQYDLFPSLGLGLTAKNVLAPKIQLKNIADKCPRDIRAGVKFTGINNVVLALDANQTQGRSIKPHIGVEWQSCPVLALRAGMDETQMTAGIGFKLGDWSLDYAFSYNDAVKGAEDLGQSHRFGLHFNFGKKASEQEVSMRWKRRGQEALEAMQHMMDSNTKPNSNETEKTVTVTRQAIRHMAYPNAQDLYAAQGYISFFEGEFERSVQSLGESLTLDPQNTRLASHLEKVRGQMTEERTREIVVFETKRVRTLYEKGDLKGTVKSCEKILSFDPNNAEAKTYLEEAKNKINEPIDRELKIAKLKFEAKQYLDAINSFNRVRELDPENAEARQYTRDAILALEKESQHVADSKVEHDVYQLDRDPEKSREYYSRGIVLYSQDRIVEAAQMWERAVKLDSQNLLAENAYKRAKIELSSK